MRESIPWVFYVSEMGRAVVAKEQQKIGLSDREYRLLGEAMVRLSQGASLYADTDLLAPEIWELRVKLPHRILRMLYFAETDPPAFVAVFMGIKKTQKTPREWIELAKSRRKSWQRLNGRPSHD